MGSIVDIRDQPIEVIVMALVDKVQRMETDLYADGIQPGMIKKLDNFMTDHHARQDEQRLADLQRDREIDERHRQNRWRLNVVIALLAALLSVLFKR